MLNEKIQDHTHSVPLFDLNERGEYVYRRFFKERFSDNQSTPAPGDVDGGTMDITCRFHDRL